MDKQFKLLYVLAKENLWIDLSQVIIKIPQFFHQFFYSAFFVTNHLNMVVKRFPIQKTKALLSEQNFAGLRTKSWKEEKEPNLKTIQQLFNCSIKKHLKIKSNIKFVWMILNEVLYVINNFWFVKLYWVWN